MALPTNSSLAKKHGCNPVSSNCVVWQGPDLDCIGLCHGDTISDVIAKLAQELCDLIDLVSLAPTSTTPFDFTCLLQAGQLPPENIHELIQLIIDRLCDQIAETTTIEGELKVVEKQGTSGTTCPDGCIMTIATCFQYTNAFGDLVTTMTLPEYATAIGNEICNILADIVTIQAQIVTLQTDVGTNAADIVTLQTTMVTDAELEYTLDPLLDPSGTPLPLPDATKVIENRYVAEEGAVGNPNDIYTNIIKSSGFTTDTRLANPGQYPTMPNWISSPTNLAESYGNLSLVAQDLYDALKYVMDNCCVTGCAAIVYNYRATLTTGPGVATVTVFLDGTTGLTGFADCSAGGSTLTISDSDGNSTTTLIPIIDTAAVTIGFAVDLTTTAVDPTLTLTVTTEACLYNGSLDTQCERELIFTLSSTASCPSVTLQAYDTAIQFDFNPDIGYTYVGQLYYLGGVSPVQIITINAPIFPTESKTFTGLITNTDYEFELLVVDGAGSITTCPKTPISTLTFPCNPPIQNGVNPIAILTP
jgi:hypothetical protein